MYNIKKIPFKCENNGGWNCELNDAKCGGKNKGGVACAVPLSNNGRKPPLLKLKKLKFLVLNKIIIKIIHINYIDSSIIFYNLNKGYRKFYVGHQKSFLNHWGENSIQFKNILGCFTDEKFTFYIC